MPGAVKRRKGFSGVVMNLDPGSVMRFLVRVRLGRNIVGHAEDLSHDILCFRARPPVTGSV
jgi:hypothetical protein